MAIIMGAAKRTARAPSRAREPRGSRLVALPGGKAEGQRLSREELEQEARAYALVEVARVRLAECGSTRARAESEAQRIAVAAASLFAGSHAPDTWHPVDLLLAQFWRLLQGSQGPRRASDRQRRRAADRCRVCDEQLPPDGACPSCEAAPSFARGPSPEAWWGRRKGTPRDLALLLVLGGAVGRGDWSAWARTNTPPEQLVGSLAKRIRTRLSERRAQLRARRRRGEAYLREKMTEPAKRV
jgi:hypothetical protein